MKFLIILLAVVLFVFIVLWVIPFCYYFITGFLTVRKIKNKVEHISFEYKVFSERNKWAEKRGIGYHQEFSMTYETDELIINTDSLSQAKYLNILKKLEQELDVLIENTSETLKSSPILSVYISNFDKIKTGIREANPYG